MATPTSDGPCNLCNAPRHYRKYDYGEVAIYRCGECGLLSLRPQPSMRQLREVYADGYFRNERFFQTDLQQTETLYGYADYFAERANKQYQLSTMATLLYDRAKALAPGRKPRLLEVGCGLGFFLDTAHDAGFDVTGIEFNPSAVSLLREKYRFPVYEGAFPDVALPDAPFEVVCAFDVIEHLPDPMAATRAMERYLVDGGFLVLVTMDATSLMSRIIGKRLEDFRRTSEHLFFFDRRTISRMLAVADLHVEEIRSTGHTFQIDQLLERCHLVFPFGFRLLRKLIRPRWLLKANVYVDLGTKISVIARKLREASGNGPSATSKE